MARLAVVPLGDIGDVDLISGYAGKLLTVFLRTCTTVCSRVPHHVGQVLLAAFEALEGGRPGAFGGGAGGALGFGQVVHGDARAGSDHAFEGQSIRFGIGTEASSGLSASSFSVGSSPNTPPLLLGSLVAKSRIYLSFSGWLVKGRVRTKENIWRK